MHDGINCVPGKNFTPRSTVTDVTLDEFNWLSGNIQNLIQGLRTAVRKVVEYPHRVR